MARAHFYKFHKLASTMQIRHANALAELANLNAADRPWHPTVGLVGHR